MGRAASAGDDDFQSSALRRLGIFVHRVWRAMGRDDAALMGNAELLEHFSRSAHRLPIGLASHDDADERRGRCGGHNSLRILFVSNVVRRPVTAYVAAGRVGMGLGGWPVA